MKICFVSPIYPIKSDPRLGIFVHEQAKYLSKEGQEVCVLTLGRKDDGPYDVIDGVKIYRVRLYDLFLIKNFLLFHSVLTKLIALDRKYNFDIINSHFVGPLAGFVGIIAKSIGKPFIITPYGIGVVPKNKFNNMLTRIYLGFTSKIVCVSNYVAKLTSQYAPKNKIIVINLGVDAKKLQPKEDIKSFKRRLRLKNEKVLLSICGLVERKGIHIVLKSLPEVVRLHPKIKYFIIGKGPEKERLKKLAKKLNLEKYVVFFDYVLPEDLANFYKICDIFVLMSKTIKEMSGVEGLGMVYLEASYCGKPVIGGKSGGTGDAIVDGVTGYRIEPTNVKKLSETILSLLRDDSLRKKLGTNGKRMVKTRFLGIHNAAKLINVYKSLVDK